MSNTRSTTLYYPDSDYFKITDANQTGLDLTGDFTLQGWFKLTTVPGPNYQYTFISKSASSGGTFGYYFCLDGKFDNTRRIRVMLSSDGTTQSIKYITWEPSTATWYHIALAYDASAGTAYVYLDAEVLGSQITGLPNSVYNNSADFLIGHWSSSSRTMDGKMDDWRVYNVCRTQAQIEADMSQEIDGATSNLQGYWRFNNNGTDETSNNNDLSAVNSPTYSTDVAFVGAVTISVNDTLSLSDDITVLRERQLSVSDTLSLSDDITMAKTLILNVNDTLSLSDVESILRERVLNVNDTLSLEDNIDILRERIIGVSDTLSLSDAEEIARILLVDFPVIISDANAGFKPTLNDDKFNPKISGDTQVFKPRINNN